MAVLKHANVCHAYLSSRLRNHLYDPAYHLQASLKAQISSFVLASAIMVMYGANQSSDFRAHLLRNARGAAVRNINDCVKAGIPCLSAICDFEIAEASSKNSTDNISGLVMYWRASLYSKALLMSFKPETDNL